MTQEARRRGLASLVALSIGVLGCSAGATDTSAVPVSPAPPVEIATPSASRPTSGDDAELDPIAEDVFWERMIPGDPDAIRYSTLNEIVSAADAIVLGTISEVSEGPTIQDPYANYIYWATVTIKVERVLAGSVSSPNPGTASVWMLLGVVDKSHDFADRFRQTAASRPSNRAVLFLSNNQAWAKQYGIPLDSPEADPMAYRILGGQGYLREQNGRVAVPVAAREGWPAAIEGIPFDEAISLISSAAPASD